ncbi:MAG: response regulator [Bacteroidia bacterium]
MKKLDCICIVDDDEIYTFLLKKALKKMDICNDISIYLNGQEAIDSIKQLIESNQVLPDIILLDINMPLLDGWEFLDEYIKIKDSITKQIAIYIASSSISIGDINRAKEHVEVIDFLVKPINTETILNISAQLRENAQ